MREWLGMSTSAIEDDNGLAVTAQLRIDKVQRAAEVFALTELAFELGNPSGLSIGFQVNKEKDNKKTSLRELWELNLMEWSVTPPGFAAAPNAKVTDIRSIADDIRSLSTDEFDKLMALLRPASSTRGPAEIVNDSDIHSLAQAVDRFNKALN
jgi:HK97 family phage prohead protease